MTANRGVTAKRVLLIFQELLKGRKMTIQEMADLCRDHGYARSIKIIQDDIKIITEMCSIVEWKQEFSKEKIYYIPSDLRRLNYF